MAREPASAPEVTSTGLPTASYNQWARRRPDVAHRSFTFLQDATQRQNLLVHGRPLCNVLRPRFLSARTYDRLARDATIIAAVFERLGAYLLRHTDLLDEIDAGDAERDLWEVDPGYSDFTATSRLDAFLTDGTAHFVEYNAESPASIGFSDVLTDVFNRLPLVSEWPDRPLLHGFESRRHLWEM